MKNENDHTGEWIKDIMSSMKDPKPVSPRSMIHEIETKIAVDKKTTVLSMSWMLAAAAAITLLAIFNIKAWTRSPDPSPSSSLKELVQEYGWNSKDIFSGDSN
jgi:hypothetical protein